MATTSVLNVEECLSPIPGDNPSGRNLAYEAVYDELREARRSEDDTLQGDWQRKAKVADWERVIELGMEILQGQSKDLQVAAWITEALGRRHAFGGLRDGFLLMLGIQEQFWETYYPEIDDGDLESRSGPFIFLESVVAPLIRSLPLCRGFGDERYSYYRWQESRATDNAGLKSQDAMDALIAEGKITGQQFDDAVAQTPKSFYETLVEDLRGSIDALKALDDSMDQRLGRDSPGVVSVRKALTDCRNVLEPILNLKRSLEPEPEDETAEPETADEFGSAEPDGSYDDEPQVAAPRRRVRPARSTGGPITSVADAHQRILEASAYLRENDPSSPAPFLVVRALRMGELYGQGQQPADVSVCEAPSSEVRMSLRKLAQEGEWTQLLEEAEQALGRPEGTAWLDAHRYALAAMASGDIDRSSAALACRSLLRTYLTDFPELSNSELGDGTPTANAETRNWLLEEIVPPAPEPVASEPDEPVTYEPPPMEPYVPDASERAADEPADVWTEALELVQGKRINEAIDLIRRALAMASSGRERFQRKLQLAELCLMANRHQVALPLSEDLARLVDEFRLEEWESEQLCARVWAAFYRCLRAVGAGSSAAEKLQPVFARLCRLDINQALALEGDHPH
ncbi:type VI secretion system protein ImpA [Singulisphaera sp. GP187]|uniref:type VI secretion system protein TssA n=1 Tax=Singulisphaera sp. GP187 TaxID=1882752 RepID=UPI000925B020|nr:type VI secretion system protein TssA [Singulisphaera sp. GP187]SIO61712.1 type VI secretion system protein ImpA [Singulisphaera sp. GP187]